MASDTILGQSLDAWYSTMPTGSLDRAILNNLSGINHRQTPSMLPSNRDMPGFAFFVRPQLNMQAENIRNVRKLSMLLNSVPTSMQTFIRCMLDPRLITGVDYGGSHSIPPIYCPVIDNKQAFIPFLTNNCTNMSPWPSISVPTFTSKPGIYNESFSMVDGRVQNSEAWDLNATFRNTRGDPILFMIYVWCLYMSLVFEGLVVPYLDFITENELDYCTRVYRLTMDYKKEKVTKISACHAGFPVGLDIGAAFAIPGDQTYADANKEISVTFKCSGVDYFDPILVNEFNKTVAIFNPEMKDGYRQATMMPIPRSLIDQYNWKGYPYIDPATSNLRWFVSMDTFKNLSAETLRSIETYNADSEEGS